MQCFYHHTEAAIGLCKSCEKGLCRQCAVDLGKGLACRGACEKDVRDLIALIESNVRAAPVSAQVALGYRRGMFLTAAVCLITGLMFAGGVGLGGRPVPLVRGIGAVLILWGIAQAVRAYRVKVPPREDQGKP